LASTSGNVWLIDTGKQLTKVVWQGFNPESLAFSPSGRILAASGRKQRGPVDFGFASTIQLSEVFSGQEIRRMERPRWGKRPLAFSLDGRILAAGDGDSSILLWDLTGGMQGGKFKPVSLTGAQLDAMWSDLAADAQKADKAIWMLARAPKQSVLLLAEHLRPGATVTADKVAKLVADLDDNSFAVRQKAAKALDDMGEAAEAGLRKTLNDNLTLEVRQRIEQILEKRNRDTIRKLRAIEALEHIATPEGRQVLEAMAQGAPNPRVAEAATAALTRLARTR